MNQKSSTPLAFIFVAAIAVILAVVVVADVSHLGSQGQFTSTPVTEICLGCICTAVSGCNRTLSCNRDVCGLFRITHAYWTDANKPVQDGDNANNPSAFENCVNEPLCAARTVQSYMSKYQQDCNGDQQINCYDHAAIHLLGGYGCSGSLPDAYKKSLEQCLSEAQSYQG